MRMYLLVLLFPVLAFSEALVCQQDPRDMRISVVIENEQVKLTVLSPLGFGYLSFFEPPISTSMLPWLKYQADQLSVLGGHFTVVWDLQDCNVQIDKNRANTRLECSGVAASSSPSIKFHNLTLARNVESTFSGDYATRKFRLVTSVVGESGEDYFFMALSVAESFCTDYE